MRSRCHGFTRIELMVLILIIGILTGLMLPAIEASQRRRGMRCPDNLRNLALGLQGYANTKGYYPNAGTFREGPGAANPAESTIRGCFTELNGVPFIPNEPAGKVVPSDPGPLRSWVVDILPYIEEQGLADGWNRNRNYVSPLFEPAVSESTNTKVSSKLIGYLICPDDPTIEPGQGDLSYVVNGGFSRWVGDPKIGWTGTPDGGRSTKTGPDWGIDVAASTGVMFLGTDTGKAPWDRRTNPARIADGTSQTILASENVRAGYVRRSPATGGIERNWACPHPNNVMFIASDKICPSGRCPTGQVSPTLTAGPKGSGNAWTLANAPAEHRFESINSGTLEKVAEGASPYPSSNHPGGVNAVFCDGSVRFIKNTIDGSVYARLITPSGSRLPMEYRQPLLEKGEF